jgi:hypothetical protein
MVLPSHISDHDYKVVLTIESTMLTIQGPSLWKLNTPFL